MNDAVRARPILHSMHGVPKPPFDVMLVEACRPYFPVSADQYFGAFPMVLDAAAAKALAAIILISTQGPDSLNSQLPLQVVDRGGSWLVKGTPYADARRGVRFCFSHVMFRKNSAEVVSIDSDIRQALTKAEEKYWHTQMSNENFDRIFGPRTQFEEGGDYLERNLFMNAAIYGGLINTQKDALAYAKVLMSQSAHLKDVPDSALRAEDRSEVWHISVVDAASGKAAELMTFSRMNGKVLSGDL